MEVSSRTPCRATLYFEKKKDELSDIIKKHKLDEKLPHTNMKVVRDGVTIKLSPEDLMELIRLLSLIDQ